MSKAAAASNGTKRLAPWMMAPEGLTYPDQYELLVDIAEVGRIKIRPFQPDDIALYETLFKSLTPRSIYLRFFCFLKQLSPSMREQLVCFDHQRDIALAALLLQGDKETMVAEARVIQTGQDRGAEFSVLVADHLQGKGIGTILMEQCIRAARELGMTTLWALVSSENSSARRLARRLGFSEKAIPRTSTRELEMRISRLG